MASSDYLNTGGGKLYIRPIVLGVKQAMTYFGSTDAVTLASNVDYIDHNSTEGSIAVLDKKVAKSRTATLNFTTGEISPEMLNRAFQGTSSDIVQDAGVAVAQTLLSVASATTYDLGVVKITSMVVQDSTDTTTYVEGTDYTYDKNTGYFQTIDGGAIADGVEIHLVIEHDAYTKTSVSALSGDQLEAELIFVSEPQVGKKYRYTFKKVSISATGDLSLKSEDFATITFEGEALVDSTVTNPVLSDYFDVELLPND